MPRTVTPSSPPFPSTTRTDGPCPDSPHPESPHAPLLRGAAVFLPADPPRCGRIAFWRPDGTSPTAPVPGTAEDLPVVLPGDDAAVAVHTTPAAVLPVAEALPVLTRARAAGTADSAAFWGAAALLALELAARERLLPGLTASGHDAWRLGPLTPEDHARLRDLAAAMPPYAHAVPLPGEGPLRLPDPERLLRAFCDAVADTLPRTPAAPAAADGPAFADGAPQHCPQLSGWAADVAAAHDAGVRISLRIEVTGLDAATGPAGSGPRFRAVVQLHSRTDPALAADAADVWPGTSPAARGFGPRARTDALLALRQAVRAWEALSPLLGAAVPDALELEEEEIAELLGGSAAQALESAGVHVHWPRALAHRLTARAVVEPDGRRASATGGSSAPGSASLLSPDALMTFGWRFSVDGRELGHAELDRLAEAGRPLVRLHDQWVLVDPEALRRAKDRRNRTLAPADALRAVLTGSVEDRGEEVEVRASGKLETLRARLADPHAADAAGIPQPAALRATLRGYQLRGLDWLHRMTSLGLGACLADDMGLGKTVTLIALHLHRRADPATAGPTLVVCPASLLGNWEREIERFAPDTPVRRYHGPLRSLKDLAPDEFVLTTYGTMRMDAGRLAAPHGGSGPDTDQPPWGLIVADEAQHVKNPASGTARRLRDLPARARVALTGTPVENNLTELWAILDWTTPGLLGRLGTFRRRYADAVEEGTDPVAAERLTRLVGPLLLRRRKSDPGIAPELPAKTETDRAVSLTAEQAGLYEAVVREALDGLAGTGGFERRGLVVKLLTSLKQICNHPAQYLEEDEPRLTGRSGKLELLDELLDTVLSEGASVLVFTQYVRMARLLEDHLGARDVRSGLLHGGTPVARREELVQSFQQGAFPVFLLSLKAAGTGLNLTRAEHVVHFDRWWNPAVEAQATDRAHRIGQTRPVQVHRLLAEGTVEDRIAALLTRKQALADTVLGSGESALTELCDAQLAELVELRGNVR